MTMRSFGWKLGGIITVAAIGNVPVVAAEKKCIGVPIRTPQGYETFTGFSVAGTQEALANIQEAARQIGAFARPPSEVDGKLRLIVLFDSDVKPDDAASLFQSVQSGSFGMDRAAEVDVKAMLFPITALTKNGCQNVASLNTKTDATPNP